MPRQAAVVAQQIAHRNAVGSDCIVQAEFRNIVTHRLGPIEAAFVDQHRQTRRGERLRNGADRKLRVGRRRQSRFGVALAIRSQERCLAILHDGNCCRRYFPFRHRLIGQGVQLFRQDGKRSVFRRGLNGHFLASRRWISCAAGHRQLETRSVARWIA